MDFLLKDFGVVIEVKKTRENLTGSEIGEQLIVDKEKYRSHGDCDYLLCFVYDPENRIENPAGLENDLSEENDITVEVLVTPK